MMEQNLAGILDTLEDTGIYVIEKDTYRMLYFNKRIRDVYHQARLGMKCYELRGERCEDCPISQIQDSMSGHVIHYNGPYGDTVDVVAHKTLWEGTTPAYVITISPHRWDFEEKEGLRQIEKVYANSLVTVFGECIITNLTKDYYVNCQSDGLWQEIPKRGYFAQENRKYAGITIHPDDLDLFLRYFSSECMIQAFLEGKKQITKRLRRLVKQGEYHMVEFTSARVEVGNDPSLWCILVYRDVNEEYIRQREQEEKDRKAKILLEEALVKAEEASMAKSDFLSKMSHDVRTPLNAIIGMTELALIHKGDAGKLEEYLEKIKISGSHLLSLISEVLDVSKIESGTLKVEREPFHLAEVVQSVKLLVQQDMLKKNQRFTAEIEEPICYMVKGDSQKIRQILVNVLENASKYTGPGGRISFRLSSQEDKESRIGNYHFVVEDNGIGIKEEDLEHIFDPFERVEDSRTSEIPGTGLGLTIVRNLVHMMGGNISVESAYESGSKFVISLPLERAGDETAAEDSCDDADKHGSGDFRGMCVLLVEDNKLNSEIASEMLQLLGVKVETALNGLEAVEMVQNHPAFYYAAVFMDIQMPVMNGYEATEKIRSLSKPCIKELPIIAMTADAFTEDMQKAARAGMAEHLSKPISIERLQKVLQDCVHIQNRNHREGVFRLS